MFQDHRDQQAHQEPLVFEVRPAHQVQLGQWDHQDQPVFKVLPAQVVLLVPRVQLVSRVPWAIQLSARVLKKIFFLCLHLLSCRRHGDITQRLLQVIDVLVHLATFGHWHCRSEHLKQRRLGVLRGHLIKQRRL